MAYWNKNCTFHHINIGGRPSFEVTSHKLGPSSQYLYPGTHRKYYCSECDASIDHGIYYGFPRPAVKFKFTDENSQYFYHVRTQVWLRGDWPLLFAFHVFCAAISMTEDTADGFNIMLDQFQECLHTSVT